jgi:hypothetical protein
MWLFSRPAYERGGFLLLPHALVFVKAIQKTTRLTAFAESVMSRPKPATVLQAVKPITAEIIVNTTTKRPTMSFFLMPVRVDITRPRRR